MGLVRQPSPPSYLPTTLKSLLFFDTNSGFIDLQALSPLCVWMVSVPWATEREYCKLSSLHTAEEKSGIMRFGGQCSLGSF